jgi:hypothetical protein
VATMPLNLVVQKALADMEAVKAAMIAPPDPALEAEAVKDAGEGLDKQPAEPDDNPPPQGNATYDDGPKVEADLVENVNAITSPPARSLLPIVEDVAGRIVRRESKAVGNAAQKHIADPAALRQWLDKHTTETRQHVTEALTPIGQTMATIGHEINVEAIADKFITRTRTDLTTLTASTDVAADLDLMLEGWQGRIEEITKDIMGEQ